MALAGDFEAIDEAALQALQANGVTEGPTLEFKRDPYGNSDDSKKEFLKDLSALANTLGGHLAIGVDETDGAAGAITPIFGDPDAELQRLENIARDSIQPRIIGLRVRAVPVSGGFVVVHQVIFASEGERIELGHREGKSISPGTGDVDRRRRRHSADHSRHRSVGASSSALVGLQWGFDCRCRSEDQPGRPSAYWQQRCNGTTPEF